MDEILKRVKGKVLCVFNGGSVGYGFASANSDNDFMIIIEDGPDFSFLKFTDSNNVKNDCIILNKDYFRKIQNLDENIYDSLAIHADIIIGCEDEKNILYLESSYKDEFYQFVNERWSNEKISRFLLRFVGFFELTMGLIRNTKKHYHVYRVKAMIDNHKKSGQFNFDYDETYKLEAIKHKESFLTLENANDKIAALLLEIKKYAKELK